MKLLAIQNDAEVRRLDELREAESRRIDGLLTAQETAVTAALAAAEKAVAAALVASEKAVNKAELAQQRVNETQNEFRGTLKDQASTLMPRSEAENTNRELRGLIALQLEEIGDLRSRLDVGPPSLHTLQTRSDESAGIKKNSLESRALLFSVVAVGFGFVGMVGTIIAIIINLIK